MSERLRVAIIPGGAFGTALTFPLAENIGRTVESVHLFIRSEEDYRIISSIRENRKHLPGHKLSDKIHLTDSYKEALGKTDVIVWAARMRHLREIAKSAIPYATTRCVSMTISKGLEESTQMTPSQVIKDIIGNDTYPCAALSGPNFAGEIATGLPTKTALASTDPALALQLQRLFLTNRFVPEISRDVIGTELGGALKNPYAMVVGICVGLNLGENAAAILKNMSAWEMTHFAVAMGAETNTIMGGLAGQADLDLSCRVGGRNYDTGIDIGKRENPQLLFNSKRTIEALDTIKPAIALAGKFGIRTPLLQFLFDVLYAGREPNDIIDLFINGHNHPESLPAKNKRLFRIFGRSL